MTTQMCAPSCSEAIGCPCPEVDNPNWVPGDPIHQETSEDRERGTTAGSLGLCGPLDTPAACEPECCPEPTPVDPNLQRAIDFAANALSKGNSLMVFDPKRTSPLNMQLAEKILASKDESILMEAERIVNGARRGTYGHPEDNFRRIADGWNWYLSNRIDPTAPINEQNVAELMVVMKIARLLETPKHRDSVCDIAGYAGCIEALWVRANERASKLAEEMD